MTKDAHAACTRCAAAVPRPEPGQWQILWDQGWRWLGSRNLFSCPDCPPVITVDKQGRHTAGPGLLTPQPPEPELGAVR
ncbi:hypothetical protein [Streptomyces microflavus]|uniref:hypothetical protein n=1 Tax=Streptomyces microflavus TaxID=1919 RepID=UPI00365D8B7A